MSLDTDLQLKLQSMTTAPVQQNYSSRDKVQPRVWYQRSTGNTELTLKGDSLAIVETTYSVEVNGTDPDATAAIADAIQTNMNGFRGQMGGSVVLGAFVQDAADDYQPRGLELDDGYHVFAFSILLIT